MKKNEIDLYGGKAKNLMQLQNDFDIPKFSVIDTIIFDDFMAHNPGPISLKSINVFDGGSRALKEAVMHGTFSNDEMDRIETLVKGLREPFAVRSSANIEDSESESLAGAFATRLFVHREDLETAIKEVYSSLYNERALEFAKEHNRGLEDLKMAIIVQEMVTNGKYSVGLFNKDGMVIQCGKKPDSVTAGSEDVDTYFVTGSKIARYPSVNGISMLFDFEIDRIADLMNKLKEHNFPLDVEFALKQGKIYLLQERRLVGNLPFYDRSAAFAAFPASPGIARGKAVILKHNNDIKTLQKGKDKVLVAEAVEIDTASMIKEYAGVCIEIPGITSHAAIYARELGVPCVVGASEITDIVENGDIIEMNGSDGSIKVLNKPGLVIGEAQGHYNRLFASYTVSYKDLKQYRHGNDLVLLIERDDQTLMFHAIKDKDRISSIANEISIRRDKPVFEGSEDIWYAYAATLELSNLDSGLLNALDKAYRVANGGSKDEIRDYIVELIEKGNGIYAKAMKSYDDYNALHDIKKFEKGFIDAHLAEAYVLIGARNMLYEFIEERAEKDDSILEFVKGMEENAYINDSVSRIRSGVDQFLDAANKDYGINYEDYSSILAVLDNIKHQSP
ncbi:MAG: hypothetical protein JRN26_03995 [Nitrososphaerota archaeon]|jgi:phosphohistidine swiveling domain-containing protein|nr:hypothetical protein [Nitrososphaerota archaeon]